MKNELLSDEDVRADDDIRKERQEYIQSQYSASSTICRILNDFRENISPDSDIDLLVNKMMDINTASGEGLDNWGRIIGMSRTLILENGAMMFLDDEQYKKMLLYKALANITDASAWNINKMMNVLFSGKKEGLPQVITTIVEGKIGDMYYNKTPMTVRWLIEEKLSDEDLALFKAGGTLCLGAGVGWTLVAIPLGETFGFAGSGLTPFNQGAFWDGSYIDRGKKMLPIQPKILSKPFCVNGARNTIPVNADNNSGLASLEHGFPTITELPIVEGGLPPQRKDFNGILYLLSAFAFWAQSGGLYTYNQELAYVPPAMVYYKNKLYVCTASNGVGVAAGTKST